VIIFGYRSFHRDATLFVLVKTDAVFHFTGLGLDNVVLVKADGSGKMIPAELQKSIQNCRAEGGTPFMVTATAG